MIDATTEEKLKLVYPDIVVRWRRVAEDMWTAHKMRLRVTEGLRGFARQWEIWEKGRKKEKNGAWIVVDPKAIVTKAMPGTSLHNYGLALDSCFAGQDPFLAKMPKVESDFVWKEFGRFAQAHGLQWGGDWNTNGKVDRDDWDRPHCQLKYGLSIGEIQSLYEYNGIKSVWAKINQIREG